MDQGPIRRPPPPRWSVGDVRELGAAVLRQLAVGSGLALVGALGWTATTSRTFADAIPITLVVAAAVMPMFTLLSNREDMAMHLDRLGQASQAPTDGDDLDGLTSVGTMLFVSVPLALAASFLGL